VKRLGSLVGAVLVAACLHADLADTLKQADDLHDAERHQEVTQLLETALMTESNARNKAEILWRLARACLNLGDAAERSGAKDPQLLALFDRGRAYGQRAIEADPQNFQGYFWTSGNTGRWGQTKGVLQSLAKAGEMRVLLTKAADLNPRDKGTFYVLGQLYREVPGVPLSFGNAEFAVNLGRRGLDLMEAEVSSGVEEAPDFDYYTELAKSLWKRNWNADRRAKAAADNRARHQAAKDELGRGGYYESTITLASMSDRQEARALVQKAISGLEALATRKQSEGDDLKEAREVLAGFR